MKRRYGTIPANTGRIDGVDVLHWSGPDHPREYGENTADTLNKLGNVGPSPRIRGE